MKRTDIVTIGISVLALTFSTVAMFDGEPAKAENGIETQPLATSQETTTQEGTTTEVRSGITSIETVGMAAVLQEEQIVASCQWADIELTRSELELLYTTVYCEAGNQPLETQTMVAQTILNRIASEKYPDTLRGVVYQRNSSGQPQFAVINWSDFEDRGWTNQVESAVHNALSYRAYPKDMYYFRDSYYHSFGQPYKAVGDMYFSTEG